MDKRCAISTYLKKECLLRGLRIGLFFFILPAFFISTPVTPWNSLEPSAQELAFQVAAVDKRTDIPVHWVTAGGGILAYGTWQHADFALSKDPFPSISHLSFKDKSPLPKGVIDKMGRKVTITGKVYAGGGSQFLTVEFIR
jgi:hypothetical protein